MRKRRVFDIDLPDAPEAAATPGSGETATFPAGKTSGGGRRRGPMASAVRENAESLRARAELEESIRTENDALAHELVRLRSLGLAVEPVAVDLIDATKLVRDRVVEADPDVDDLKESLRAIGLSNPIRVERAGERYELIQGWRRLHAFRDLFRETGDESWAAIPAGIVAPGDDLETSYRRMVDENLVRKNVSFAEMAELARGFAADPQTDCRDVDQAVAMLFRSAPYQKRSYIRAFAQLLDQVGGSLLHPREIPRNLGLDLRRRLSETGADKALRASLDARPERTAEEELALLRAFAVESGDKGGRSAARPTTRTPDPARSRTRLDVELASGAVRCEITGNRITLRGGEDVSSVDSARLERAVAAFYEALKP